MTQLWQSARIQAALCITLISTAIINDPAVAVSQNTGSSVYDNTLISKAIINDPAVAVSHHMSTESGIALYMMTH